MAWIELAGRSIGLILLASAIAKLIRPDYFLRRLGEYSFVPGALAVPLGFCAILGEAVVSVVLLTGVAATAGFIAAAALFAIFAAASWLELRAGSAAGGSGIDCGCLGGVLPLRLGRAAMMLNLGVCLVAVACAIASVGVSGVSDDEVGTGMLWALAALLAASYWIAQFAFAVVGRMRTALEAQRRPA